MTSHLSLSAIWPQDTLDAAMLSKEEWKPYPDAQGRAAWDGLPENTRLSLSAAAEEAAIAPWPHVPASIYREYAVDGNRTHYEDLHFARRKILAALVLGECSEGQGRWLPAILDAIWSICEESSWCLPAHIGVQRAGSGLPDTREPTLDLFAAETGALLAWTLYLLKQPLAEISPLIAERITREVDQRVLTPALERDDYGWMGFKIRPVNNWNPWINSNWLASALLLEQDGDRRLKAVSKILRSLDMFLVDYPEDGGCDEGPNYWGRAGASLFDCLDLLHNASAGKLNAFSHELVGNMARYIYRAHIGGDYYLNFADASAVVQPEAVLVYRFGKQIRDDAMQSFGAWLAHREHLFETFQPDRPIQRTSSLGRELPALFSLGDLRVVKAGVPLLRDTWLPGIQVFTARDEAGSEKGFYLAAKGGHNDESHNHNDIGQFVIYTDGQPLIIDAGVETYTRKTFSPQRYEIWTMQSAYHSLPLINDIQQAEGREYKAGWVRYEQGEGQVGFELEIAPAYPPEAMLQSWVRKLTFTRGKDIQVSDRYVLDKTPGSLSLSLMTASRVDLSNPGIIRFEPADLPGGRRAGSGLLHYDAERFAVELQRVPISDERMAPVWGSQVQRIVLKDRKPAASGSWLLVFQR
jgi:hypothetical protein